MRKVLLVFDCDNGYSCSCCGRWWEETKVIEIKDDESLQSVVKKIQKETVENYEINRYGRNSITEAHLIVESWKEE